MALYGSCPEGIDVVAGNFLLQLPHGSRISGITLDAFKRVQVGHVCFLHHSPFISPHALKVNGKDINRLGRIQG